MTGITLQLESTAELQGYWLLSQAIRDGMPDQHIQIVELVLERLLADYSAPPSKFDIKNMVKLDVHPSSDKNIEPIEITLYTIVAVWVDPLSVLDPDHHVNEFWGSYDSKLQSGVVLAKGEAMLSKDSP